jgi:pimeloyl-ACP methyl ester carboxylesterase
VLLAFSFFGGVGVAQEGASFQTEDGGFIDADLYGRGPHGIVLAHGYRFDKRSWENQAETLSEAGFRVLAFDFRGYGKSEGPGQAQPLSAPLHLDVLAAVRYLRSIGASEISVIGASMGAEAAARASAEATTGEIDRLVLLAGGVSASSARLQGAKLFVVSEGDKDPSGSLLVTRIKESYRQADEPKQLLVLEGSAHAQAIFNTEYGQQLMDQIVLFLSASQGTTDRESLLSAMNTYLDAVSSHRHEIVPLSPNAVIRENTRELSFAESAWRSVSEIVSRQVFADPESGNVVARTGVRLHDGRVAYVSTRLKVVGDLIEEVETSFDDGKNVFASNVITLDPIFTTLVPPEDQMGREQLERIGRSYYQALTDHMPVVTDFDERCDRYHSGQRVTNNAANSVEGSAPRSCVESFAGPWGPALEHRFPVIDPTRGVVVGYTLLVFPNEQRMYVSEVFKILDGRIRLIDNVGVMMTAAETMGFPAPSVGAAGVVP